jgi:hypothetical protein
VAKKNRVDISILFFLSGIIYLSGMSWWCTELYKYSGRDATNPAAEAVISLCGTEDVYPLEPTRLSSFQCCTHTQGKMPLILLQKLWCPFLVQKMYPLDQPDSVPSSAIQVVRTRCH